VLADAPCKKRDNLQSDHHCGGQNVFFQDGHVKFQIQSTLPDSQHDAIYLNNAGEEAAGLGRNDTVLGRSEATPGRVGLELAQ
jgi:prepilin-type processing-associated H-X9-DG protein